LPGDHGAHGDFDAAAWDFSPQFWAATHEAFSWGAIALAGLAIGYLLAGKKFTK